jgi:phosphoribosyl-ATP pyrophosphohydrolase
MATMNLEFLNSLSIVISERRKHPKSGSYTSELLHGHIDRLLKKIGEEAGEVIIAAKNKSKKELTNETADLIFHLMLTLEASDLTLSDVVEVLKKRHSQA